MTLTLDQIKEALAIADQALALADPGELRRFVEALGAEVQRLQAKNERLQAELGIAKNHVIRLLGENAGLRAELRRGTREL